MNEDRSRETEKPEFWIQDYWNVWNTLRMGISFAREDNDTQDVRRDSAQTFLEYVSGREYYGKTCDISIIPQEFIRTTDALVESYNTMIAQEQLDLDKLEKIVYDAGRAIYGEGFSIED